MRPDSPPEGQLRVMRDGETETEFAPAMQERASGAGLVMKRPHWSPNTIPVHEATAYAREKGLGGEFHHAAAKAYWERGVDLSDTTILKEIADESGLDWAELSSRLASGHHRAQVLQEDQDGRDRGVGGTPTYLIGEELIWGDLSLEDLNGLVEKAS